MLNEGAMEFFVCILIQFISIFIHIFTIINVFDMSEDYV